MSFKSGFVSIIGRPNVGKSTLMNKICGEKLAIMSSKPQTTRNVIKAFVTTDDYQIIFLDTPGMHVPKTRLGEYMMTVAKSSTQDVDAVVVVYDVSAKISIEKTLSDVGLDKPMKTPVFLVLNKIDLIEKEDLLAFIAKAVELYDFAAIVPVSAKNNDGVDTLMEEITKVLPEGPQYYPEDLLTDQPEREIVAELIREKILKCTSDEVPHGVGIEIMEFKGNQSNGVISIKADIYCEKSSHKGILIGKNGAMLKKIGEFARKDIEKLLDSKVYLQLWVKVKDDWRNKDSVLKTLGYK